MKKILFVAAILGASVALFLVLRAPEPAYHGRTITAWIDDSAGRKDSDYSEAFKQIGTNAIPYAVRNIMLNDSQWRSNYIILQSRLPKKLQKLFPKPKPILRDVDGASVFSSIGSNSIPAVIALLKHNSPSVRRAALWGIVSLRRQSSAANQAIPALIEALADRDRMVHFGAVLSFSEMGPSASNAVPALTKIAAGAGIADVYLRAAAAVSLGKIGPAAASALPVLKAALIETNSYFRGQVAVAIWRIDSDVSTTLPILLQEMPGTTENYKWDWFVALGEMGPRAKEAGPQLKQELKQDKVSWNLNHVTNALKSIDPSAAAEAGVK